MFNWRPAGMLALLAIVPTLAAADASIGGSRLAGMANAGLALPVDFGNTGQRNPAMYAHLARRFGLITPELAGGIQGLSVGDIGTLAKFSGSSLNTGVVSTLATQYGDGNKSLDALADIGLDIDGFAIVPSVSAAILSYPNAALQTWARSGAQGTPPLGARLDAYGYGYYSVDLGYGVTEKTPIGGLDLGAQVKAGHSYFSHYVAMGQAGTDPVSVAPAPDMPSKDYLDEESAGLDLGIHLAQANSPMHYAVVVQNAIEPKLGYTAIAPGGVGTEEENPFRRQFCVGTAWMQHGTSVAIDVQDIGNHANLEAIRGGVDTHVGPIGLRAGFDSRTGPAVGFTVLGINFAISRQSSMSLAYALRF